MNNLTLNDIVTASKSRKRVMRTIGEEICSSCTNINMNLNDYRIIKENNDVYYTLSLICPNCSKNKLMKIKC